jgi:hypothetical protein
MGPGGRPRRLGSHRARFTRDVDLVIAVAGDRDAEQVVHALQQRGYDVQALVEQEAAGRLATARLVPRGGDEAAIVPGWATCWR